MRRIGLAVALTVSLLAASTASEAPPSGTGRRIALFSTIPISSLTEPWWEAFVASLREQGWVEHQNIVIERRYTEQRKGAALAVAERSWSVSGSTSSSWQAR